MDDSVSWELSDEVSFDTKPKDPPPPTTTTTTAAAPSRTPSPSNSSTHSDNDEPIRIPQPTGKPKERGGSSRSRSRSQSQSRSRSRPRESVSPSPPPPSSNNYNNTSEGERRPAPPSSRASSRRSAGSRASRASRVSKRASPSAATNTSTQSSVSAVVGVVEHQAELSEIIRMLSDQRDDEAAAGRYLNAKAIQERIDKIKVSEEYKTLMALQTNAENTQRAIEQAQVQDYLSTEADWQDKLAALEYHSKELEAELIERHENELSTFWAECDAEPERPRWSRDLLNLRTRELAAAKTGAYEAAHTVQAKADQMEAWELRKYRYQRQKKNEKKEGLIIERQKRELAALRRRVDRYRKEGMRRRDIDIERMLKAFQATRMDVDSRAATDKIKTEKYFTQNFHNPLPNYSNNGGRGGERDPGYRSLLRTTGHVA